MLVARDLSAGTHHVSFRGDDLASGVYFVSLESAGQQQVKKMVFMK